MANGPQTEFSQQIKVLFDAGAVGLRSDGELLRRFVDHADDVAFEALVARHGPMVLRTCRRALHDEHAADDAFQATFLVLARRAGSVRDHDAVARWLQGVAARVAARAKVEAARRSQHERAASLQPAQTDADPELRERVATLLDEVERLPDNYRLPITLCYLDGLTCEQAAARLGRSVGTITVQLTRARNRLRDRLTRRGLSVTAGLVAILLDQQAKATATAVPPALVGATVRAAIQFASRRAVPSAGVPARVAALSQGALHAMLLTKIKIASALVFVPLVTGTIFGLGAISTAKEAARDRSSGAPRALMADDKPADKSKPDPDRPKLQGRWQALSIEGANGKSEGRGSEADRFKLEIDGDKIVFTGIYGLMGGDGKGTFALDSSPSPKVINMDLDRGKIIGIYELEGDRLTICLNKIGIANRPKEFTADATRFVFVFERNKP